MPHFPNKTGGKRATRTQLLHFLVLEEFHFFTFGPSHPTRTTRKDLKLLIFCGFSKDPPPPKPSVRPDLRPRQWPAALRWLRLLGARRTSGVDFAICGTACISACEATGRWREALQARKAERLKKCGVFFLLPALLHFLLFLSGSYREMKGARLVLSISH